MNIEELQEIFLNFLVLIVPIVSICTAIRFLRNVISEGSSYGFMDFISDSFDDLIDWIKSIFHKSSKKKPIEFYNGKQGAGMSLHSDEWDNGFFNSDVYNSRGDKND